MAKKIASFDPMAVRSAKQAVLRGLDLSLSEGLELERRLAMALRGAKRKRVER
jgi:enoyl-CoA hydratase/carnithine racemase